MSAYGLSGNQDSNLLLLLDAQCNDCDARQQLTELKQQITEYRDEAAQAIIEEQKRWQEMTEYKNELAELKQHLREIEWSDEEGWYCPVCDGSRDGFGHTDTCWLAQAIKE